MNNPDGKTSNSSSHVWPAVRLGLAAEISALAEELNAAQWLSDEEIAAQKLQQFAKLLSFAIEHSPFYARCVTALGAGAGDFHSLESVRQLPILSRQDIQAAGADFFNTDVPAD